MKCTENYAKKSATNSKSAVFSSSLNRKNVENFGPIKLTHLPTGVDVKKVFWMTPSPASNDHSQMTWFVQLILMLCSSTCLCVCVSPNVLKMSDKRSTCTYIRDKSPPLVSDQ